MWQESRRDGLCEKWFPKAILVRWLAIAPTFGCLGLAYFALNPRPGRLASRSTVMDQWPKGLASRSTNYAQMIFIGWCCTLGFDWLSFHILIGSCAALSTNHVCHGTNWLTVASSAKPEAGWLAIWDLATGFNILMKFFKMPRHPRGVLAFPRITRRIKGCIAFGNHTIGLKNFFPKSIAKRLGVPDEMMMITC